MATRRIARIAALTGAALLMSGFVLYKSGRLKSLMGKDKEPGTATGETATQPYDPDEEHLSSSKSMLIEEPPPLVQLPGDDKRTLHQLARPKLIKGAAMQRTPLYMPGSKSAEWLIEP